MHERNEFEVYEGNDLAQSICYMYNLFELENQFEYPELGSKEEVDILLKSFIKRVNQFVFEGKDENYEDEDRVYYDMEDTNEGNIRRVFDITPTYKKEKGEIKEVQFTVVPLRGFELEVLHQKFKRTFSVDAGVNFFRDLLRELAICIGLYKYNELLADNLVEFNDAIKNVIKQHEFEEARASFTRLLFEDINKLKLKYMDKTLNKEKVINFDTFIEHNSEDKVEPIVDLIDIIMKSIRVSGYKSNDSNKTSITDLKKIAKEKFVNQIFEQISQNNYVKKLQTDKFDTFEVFTLLRVLADAIIKITRHMEQQSSHKVSFGLGKGFIDVSEEEAVIGLSEEVIKDLSSLPILEVQAYRDDLRDAIFYYEQPYGIVKVPPKISIIPDKLGIYSVKALHTLLKEYAHRPIYSSKARIGVSYYETDEIFGIIEKTAITEKDAQELNKDEMYRIIDNLDITEEEKKKGLKKIKVTFKIKPYNKKTNEYVDISLEDILKNK